ncbi:MAG: 3'(2'),5'-bisphosphate nucleotidase CysQ [Gammaproteobacteria bacterium]|nr:3'(2'),5'-bisphosphate nucleotidase CysQ [Gammaproteobacteria bacterium]
MNITQYTDPLVTLAEEAGRAILEIYETDFDVEKKDDQSPLTKADLASNARIVAGLEKLTPEIPIISEEVGLADFEERRQWDCYWLIDPLDGTKEFVKRNGEFTVNIALIRDHAPVLGIVHVPVTKTTYIGCEGLGAERREAGKAPCRIAVATESDSPVRVVGSRSHLGTSLNTFLQILGEFEMHPMGSSLKFCLIAEGGADIYPRLGLTSEWDTAAAQAVVEQAGGQVLELDGNRLSYNRKADILNPHFLVIGAQDHDWLGIAQRST